MPRYVYDVAIGDVNGDGRADLIAAIEATIPSSVTILLGDGSGNFGPAQDFAVDSVPSSVAIADFNRDGMLDIVTSASGSTGVTVLLNMLPINKGTFTIKHSFTFNSTGGSSGTVTEGSPGVFFGQSAGGIWSITSAGVFQLVHPFNPNVEGQSPNGYLLEGRTGRLYGVTTNGGVNG